MNKAETTEQIHKAMTALSCALVGFFGDPQAPYVDYCSRCEGLGEVQLPEGILNIEPICPASYSPQEREYALLVAYSYRPDGIPMVRPTPRDVGALVDFLEFDDASPEDNLDVRYAE